MLIREYVGQTFGQEWHYKHFDERRIPFMWHSHPEFEITLTLHARGTRYIGSDVAPFGEQDLALVGANQAHTWYAEREAGERLHHGQVIFFSRRWLQDISSAGLPELSGFLHWLDGVGQGVVFSQACIERLATVFERLPASRGLSRLLGLFEIFEGLMADDAARRLPHAAGPALGDARLEAAIAHLQSRFQRPINLGELAERAHVSTATLKRLFQQRMGLSVTEVLTQLRLNHACKLLISSSHAVQRVAEESGFANYSNFCRHFKTIFLCTPADFRRRYHLQRIAQETPLTHDLQTASLWLNPDNYPESAAPA